MYLTKNEFMNIAVIDQSPGNGHMFSFASLFNGYKQEEIQSCPFPIIREYLPKHVLPSKTLNSRGTVTETWMQDPEINKQLQSFLGLTTSFQTWQECIESVDAVIITNDEPSKSRKEKIVFALSREKLVFVDKILALENSDIVELVNSQFYEGQLFAASGVPYAPCFNSICITEDFTKLIIEIPKSWRLYGIHGIELALNILDNLDGAIYEDGVEVTAKETRLKLRSECFDELTIEICTTGEEFTPISITTVKKDSSKKIIMSDPLLAFENMLNHWLSPDTRNAKKELDRYLKVAKILGMAR
jgi:hypothetical protein